MPFITEEIWQQVKSLAGKSGETIMFQPYPLFAAKGTEGSVQDEMEWVMQFILAIRKIKGEMNIAPGKPVPVLLANTNENDRAWAGQHRAYLDFLARTETVEVLPEGEEGPESATALVGQMKVLIPLAGLIDKTAELARLDKEIGRLDTDILRLEKKLDNPSFAEKAPPQVVQKERDRLATAQQALQDLGTQRDKIAAL
jgi:valyl-tRNA synthetase